MEDFCFASLAFFVVLSFFFLSSLSFFAFFFYLAKYSLSLLFPHLSVHLTFPYAWTGFIGSGQEKKPKRIHHHVVNPVNMRGSVDPRRHFM
jgi:hypothetical protein